MQIFCITLLGNHGCEVEIFAQLCSSNSLAGALPKSALSANKSQSPLLLQQTVPGLAMRLLVQFQILFSHIGQRRRSEWATSRQAILVPMLDILGRASAFNF